MTSDQLTHNERIRIEALTLAVMFLWSRHVQGSTVVEFAEKFEEFIRAADIEHESK